VLIPVALLAVLVFVVVGVQTLGTPPEDAGSRSPEPAPAVQPIIVQPYEESSESPPPTAAPPTAVPEEKAPIDQRQPETVVNEQAPTALDPPPEPEVKITLDPQPAEKDSLRDVGRAKLKLQLAEKYKVTDPKRARRYLAEARALAPRDAVTNAEADRIEGEINE
jgi:hypothetical protein